ncbi:MAG: hypothetical protein ACMUJM_22890 [bacterium]
MVIRLRFKKKHGMIVALACLLSGLGFTAKTPYNLPKEFYFTPTPNYLQYRIMSIPEGIRINQGQDWIGVFDSHGKCIGGAQWEGEHHTLIKAYTMSEYPSDVRFKLWQYGQQKVFSIDSLIKDQSTYYAVTFTTLFPDTKDAAYYQSYFESILLIANNELKNIEWFIHTNNRERVHAHLSLFAQHWQKIKEHYAEIPPPSFQTDIHWQGDIEEVVHLLNELHSTSDLTLRAVHNKIDTVRSLLTSQRERSRIVFMGDLLVHFYHVMKELDTELSKGNRDSIGSLFQELEWRYLKIENFMPHKITHEEKKLYLSLQQELKRALQEARLSFESGHSVALKERITELKRCYQAMYLLFG